MNIREKINLLMQEKNITRAELSRETGIPYTTIDSILKRDDFERVKLSVVQTLSKYFNVSLDYLIKEEITDKRYGTKKYFEKEVLLDDAITLETVSIIKELKPKYRNFILEQAKNFLELQKDEQGKQ